MDTCHCPRRVVARVCVQGAATGGLARLMHGWQQ